MSCGGRWHEHFLALCGLKAFQDEKSTPQSRSFLFISSATHLTGTDSQRRIRTKTEDSGYSGKLAMGIQHSVSVHLTCAQSIAFQE
eukprot:5581725-Amphidinium_carterae.1